MYRGWPFSVLNAFITRLFCMCLNSKHHFYSVRNNMLNKFGLSANRRYFTFLSLQNSRRWSYRSANGVLPLFLFCLYSNIFATPLICFVHVWQTGGLFPTGDPIVPFVIRPRFECLTWHLWGTWLSSLLWPIYRISLVGYHCSIEFPCGVPLFYCCKYPTLYARTHPQTVCLWCKLRTSCYPLCCWSFTCLGYPIWFVHVFQPRAFANNNQAPRTHCSLCYKSSVCTINKRTCMILNSSTILRHFMLIKRPLNYHVFACK